MNKEIETPFSNGSEYVIAIIMGVLLFIFLTSCCIPNQAKARHRAYIRYHYQQYLKDSLRINHLTK